jgi:hypothetical protein
MDDQLKYKIKRVLLIAGFAFMASGIVMLILDISWVTRNYRVSNPIVFKNPVNGWIFLLLGAGMFYGRLQLNKKK